MLYPCRKCKNIKFSRNEIVLKYLVNRRFTPNYYIWFQHEKSYGENETTSSSSSSNFKNAGNTKEPIQLHNENEEKIVNHDRVHDMVTYAFF